MIEPEPSRSASTSFGGSRSSPVVEHFGDAEGDVRRLPAVPFPEWAGHLPGMPRPPRGPRLPAPRDERSPDVGKDEFRPINRGPEVLVGCAHRAGFDPYLNRAEHDRRRSESRCRRAFAHGDEVLAPISDRFDHHLRIVRQGRRTIVDRQVHDHDTVAARPKPRSTRCLYQPMSPASWIGTWVAMAVSGRVGGALQLSDLDRRHGLLVESGAVGRSCRRNLMRQLASVLGPGSVMPDRSRDRHIPTFQRSVE